MTKLAALFLVCVFCVMVCDAWKLPEFIKNSWPFKIGQKIAEMTKNAIKKVKSKLGGIIERLTGGLDTDKTLFGGVVKKFKKKLLAIYPGTKWCGDGNKAKTDEDLGYFRQTDKCCRQHDKCPDNIEKEHSKHNLTNIGLFTRSNCACERKFYRCLKASRNPIGVAFQIGTTYFTILGPQCFKKDYPILICIKRKGLLTKRCVDYQFNKSAEEIYQWFDNPYF